MSEDNLTNLAGLAACLRLPAAWLREEANAGRLPFLRIGRKKRFNVQAVRDALAKRAAEGSGNA